MRVDIDRMPGRAGTQLVEALRQLDPDSLRAEVRAAAARTGS